MLKVIFACLAVITSVTPALAQVDFQDLQAIRSRFPPSGWTNVQVFSTTGWTTINVTSASAVGAANVITPDTPAIDAAQKIENIIAGTTGNRILYFPAGTYYLNTHLQVNQSGVYLLGDGVAATQFTIAPSAANDGEVEFAGPGLGAEVDVVGITLPVRGATTIPVASAAGLAVGDIVHVYDKNLAFTNGFYHYGQMAEITGVSGSNLTLSPALGLDFIGDAALKEVHVIRNVGIRGIHVYRTPPTAPVATTNNIEFSYVKNGVAREIEASLLIRGGVTAFFSMDVVIVSSFVHEAYSYGAGGDAYGFLLTNNTTRSRVTDNKAWDLRHHFIVQRGANNSIVSYNSAESGFLGTTAVGDLITHGFTVHNTLFEGNMGRDLMMDLRADPNQLQYQGLWNTFYRNNITRYSGSDITISLPDDTGNYPQQHPTVIGNAVGAISVASGTVDPWVGANRIGSTVILGNAPSGWVYPPSLYLTTKPTYFGTRPWPIFGPGIDPAINGTFGINNNLPAFDRDEP